MALPPQHVVLRLADEDRDGTVSRKELVGLQLKGWEWAKTFAQKNWRDVTTLPQLLDVLFMGFDRKELRREFELKRGAGSALKIIADGLQVGLAGISPVGRMAASKGC